MAPRGAAGVGRPGEAALVGGAAGWALPSTFGRDDWGVAGADVAAGSGSEWAGCDAGSQRGAESVRGAPRAAEYCVEGSADGCEHLDCRALFSEDDYAAGNVDGAGGAESRGSGADFPDGASFLRTSAGGAARGRAADIASQCRADELSRIGQRVPRGERRGGKRRARLDDPEPAWLRGGALAGRGQRGAGGAAGCTGS